MAEKENMLFKDYLTAYLLVRSGKKAPEDIAKKISAQYNGSIGIVRAAVIDGPYNILVGI